MTVYVVYRVYECEHEFCPACDIPLAAFSSEDDANKFKSEESQSGPGHFDVEMEPIKLNAEVKEPK